MENHPTDQFTKENLLNRNRTLAAYQMKQNNENTPLEEPEGAFSDSLGFWLQYAIERKDPFMFQDGYQLLTKYFMDEEGCIYRKLDPAGRKIVSRNSLVTDFRIIASLFKAAEGWKVPHYYSTAAKISKFINIYNKRGDMLVDFYDKNTKQNSDILTLSSINPLSLKEMKAHGVIDIKTYIKMIDLLDHIPKQNGYYAKAYNVRENRFVFNSDIDMLDQSLIALHRADDGAPPDSFFNFIKMEFQKNGLIYKMYNKDSKRPSSDFESPALYGFSILYCLKIGELEFAQLLYNKMIQFKEANLVNDHYGGYSIYLNCDSSIFDTLVPLIAEQLFTQYQYTI